MQYWLTFYLAIVICSIVSNFIESRKHRKVKKNIVLFITDDQDVELGSMDYMPKTLEIFRREGVEFTNGFVTTPICCPSRSSILTGFYVHNHNVHSNNENCTGEYWRHINEPNTFAVHLAKNGYKTGYFGKYLNEYNGSYVPAGWQEWMGLVKNSRFYNYTVNYNGVKIKHAQNYAQDYFTDLIVNDSLAYFKREYKKDSDTAFLLVLSFPAPHGPEDPAPQYNSMFANVTSHRTASWNYAPNPDKQWILQHTGKMEPVHVAFTDFLQRRRLQTLQSVDEAVRRVYNEFRNVGELRNTYFMYTSDHGYHLGQFGLIKGKSMPYDFDLRVPYFIRGPEVPANTKIWEPVLNIDLAPTILDMAGVNFTADTFDGRSVLPLIRRKWERISGQNSESLNKIRWRHSVLIERGMRPKLLKLRERLRNQNERYSKELRIQKECERPEYQPPCHNVQQWECRRNEVGRWRIFKCRGDVAVEKECRCGQEESNMQNVTQNVNRQKTQSERRGRRSVVDEREGELYSQHVQVHEFESGAHGDVATISEQTLHRWEHEFFNHVLRKEIVEGVGWFQGVFDAVQDPIDVDDDVECSSIEEHEEQELIERKKREIKRKRKQNEQFSNDKEVVVVRGCSLYANHTVRCPREVYSNMNEWREEKNKLDSKIRNLRHKLQEMIGIRRHLKEERPVGQVLSSDPSFWNVESKLTRNDEETLKTTTTEDVKRNDVCSCSSAADHPLKHASNSFPVGGVEMSDVELLAYAEERRKSRQEQRRGSKGQKHRNQHQQSQFDAAEEKRLHCNVPNLNCFTHDNNHWRTPPYWTLGPFCFCQNSNNNTYWCLRTVNATHDFLYCEFVTGFVSFYDMTKDKHQLNNRIYTLPFGILEQLSSQLDKLRKCKGSEDCERHGRVN